MCHHAEKTSQQEAVNPTSGPCRERRVRGLSPSTHPFIQKIPEYARLSQQELNMTITRSLVAVNPNAPPNKVTYDYHLRSSHINDGIDQTAIHFSMEGDYIHTTSNEYKIQEQINEVRKINFNKYRA